MVQLDMAKTVDNLDGVDTGEVGLVGGLIKAKMNSTYSHALSKASVCEIPLEARTNTQNT